MKYLGESVNQNNAILYYDIVLLNNSSSINMFEEYCSMIANEISSKLQTFHKDFLFDYDICDDFTMRIRWKSFSYDLYGIDELKLLYNHIISNFQVKSMKIGLYYYLSDIKELKCDVNNSLCEFINKCE